MNEISLEWFFQIPGLFITIGVLLILIALLVLIIGSSKARNKKEVNVSEEALMPTVEPVANPNETVNVVANTNDTLGVENINNANLTNNNVSEINGLTNNVNTIAESVTVNNNDNIMPVGEAAPSIVTPVNINESVEIPMVETANVSEVAPVIFEPVINKIEEVSQDALGNVNTEIIPTPVEVSPSVTADTLITPVVNEPVNNNSMPLNNDVKPMEATMAPIFSEPEAIVNSSVLENPVEFKPTEPILKVSETVSEPVVNNVVEPITEPIVPVEPKVEATVPIGGNVIVGTTMIPIVENIVPTSVAAQDNEVEEIL